MEAQHKVQIVLLGSTGCGKSAAGNIIVDKKVFKSYASTQSVTVSYQTASATVDGMEVTVVDTPGWHCTRIPEDEVTSQIKTAILSLNGPYAFLMVIPIGSFTEKDLLMVSKLPRALGDDFINHTTILFTHSDNLEEKSFEEFLMEEKGALHSLVQQCGNRVHAWNNKDSSSVKNMDKMLEDLKKSQKTNQTSTAFSQSKIQNENVKQEQELMTLDVSDAHIKRHKRDTKEPLENPQEEIRVVVLGMAGVGKTATIKTLSGQKVANASSTHVYKTSKSGVNLMLIDSPGIKDVNEVENVISQSFSSANPGPHVIMIVIKVGRVTEETFKMIECIHACLSDNSVAYTMILFTGKDDLYEKNIEEFIKESPELKTLVEMHDNRFHTLNNRDANDQTQVNELLEKISKMYQENSGGFIKEHEQTSISHGKEKKPKVFDRLRKGSSKAVQHFKNKTK